MTQEELLLKDLCARLPYRVKCRIKGKRSKILVGIDPEGLFFRTRTPDKSDWCYYCYDIEEWSILPYLRPMSSMTEKEQEEFFDLIICVDKGKAVVEEDKIYAYNNFIYSHHLDNKNFIEKGLALEAPDGMYSKT